MTDIIEYRIGGGWKIYAERELITESLASLFPRRPTMVVALFFSSFFFTYAECAAGC